MPELPEVETTKRGLEPLILKKRIINIEIRAQRLREPLDTATLTTIVGKTITHIRRRAKYLLFILNHSEQALLVHLGMSGSLRVVPSEIPPKTHDHIVIGFADGSEMRFHDPRRFGHFSLINQEEPQKLLEHLGPEPFSETFTGEYLFQKSRGRKIAVKTFIMNQDIVVGVGNIYATEALFLSGIRPGIGAGRISLQRYLALVANIKKVLARSIDLGGSTLRDFVNPEGNGGYFQQTLLVYGKSGQPCPSCSNTLIGKVISGRMSVYCPRCQK